MKKVLLLLALLVGGAVVVRRLLPADIGERLARGEITKEEFDRIRGDLA